MSNLFDLSGKIALITGSTRGIGHALAIGLAEHGAHVVLNGRRRQETEDAAQHLREKGLKVDIAIFDVTKPEECSKAIDVIEEEIGPIHILVNSAGIQRRHPFTEFPLDEWTEIIAVNQTAPFVVSQLVARRMMSRRRGKIINIGSMQSELGRDNITPYACSKGAVKMLTRGMCVELARYNIQVNGIAPGYFITDMTQSLVQDKKFSSWLEERTPAARWGNPQELVGATVLLASNGSDFINGQLLFVDGGMSVSV